MPQADERPQTDPSKAVNLGVAAHITAASAGGPRFEAALVESQRVSGENGLWLCQTCAKLVDNDPARYTVEILLAWKREAERRAIRDLETSPAGVALTLSSFAVDTSTCSYAEHRWDPDHQRSLAQLGATLGKRGAVDEALPLLEKAVALDPKDKQSQGNLKIP